MNARPGCHFCGNCMAGCDVVAKYNSADVHIAPAEKSGQVTVFHDSVAREVLVSKDNRAIGVRYQHRVHQREGEVRGRAVVVACACVQSAGPTFELHDVALVDDLVLCRYPRAVRYLPDFSCGEALARRARSQVTTSGVRVSSGSTCSRAAKAAGRVVGEAWPNTCGNAENWACCWATVSSDIL